MTLSEKIFCQGCKQRISKSGMAKKLLTKGSEDIFEFEDGFYCSKCAKIKVEKERRNF